MASTGGSAALPTGCFKCGRPGHWGRDCTANPGGTAPAAGGASGGRSSTTGGFSRGNNSWRGKGGEGRTDQKGGQPGSQYNKSAPKEIIPKEPKKRPKLTADLLLSEGGLGYVLEKMPELVTIKGREDTVVRDLKSLLEGYMHWHSLLLPYFSFDQFVDKVEKLGSVKRVRLCTRELREKILYGKGSKGDEEAEAEATAEPGSKNAPKDTSVGPEREADQGIGPDDIFTNEEPEVPLNDEDFEDFFRQGVEEPVDTRPSSTAVGGAASEGDDAPRTADTRAISNGESAAGEGAPRNAARSITISESAAARMEANRLQALERARARRAGNGQL